YKSLRSVPAYPRFIRERFERCLDLYLCPRVKKNRIMIDPDALLPKLPKRKDLRPFPHSLSLRYLGHRATVRSLSLHPSGQWMASGSDDGTSNTWHGALLPPAPSSPSPREPPPPLHLSPPLLLSRLLPSPLPPPFSSPFASYSPLPPLSSYSPLPPLSPSFPLPPSPPPPPHNRGTDVVLLPGEGGTEEEERAVEQLLEAKDGWKEGGW
ncbi:unnamed protein product, partial [Closterium sp. NIES-54]